MRLIIKSDRIVLSELYFANLIKLFSFRQYINFSLDKFLKPAFLKEKAGLKFAIKEIQQE
ncbi:hypothetical protein COS75_02725 [Candidatus Pacearchaeota archaeon CG06_land_8_20_14_3_00_35_12]|nr:MAG: hypothetical protein COS75_02725 [Candidatus Pacearchaeota archaeon CG06_land_8_20_14_3_00_35_12]